ncbi:VOC family protein [Granulicoccus phenolivorans]|uniref:VOC family protein n=1 Tax=Granulicoccus phenolivorans TaxID=266854 RepID=UPI0004792AA1|nr:VOC family protein [Granulicoccus phenolivorans]
MSRVVHFELHASQPQVLIDFYTKLLGWEFAQFGDNPYWAIITGTTGDGINGGLAQRQGDPPEPGSPLNAATIVVPVDNVDESYAAALADGAAEAIPPADVPGVGRLAYIQDPDGNVVGLLTPAPGGMDTPGA